MGLTTLAFFQLQKRLRCYAYNLTLGFWRFGTNFLAEFGTAQKPCEALFEDGISIAEMYLDVFRASMSDNFLSTIVSPSISKVGVTDPVRM